MSARADDVFLKYFGVNWKILWDVIQHKLPDLESQLRALIAN